MTGPRTSRTRRRRDHDIKTSRPHLVHQSLAQRGLQQVIRGPPYHIHLHQPQQAPTSQSLQPKTKIAITSPPREDVEDAKLSAVWGPGGRNPASIIRLRLATLDRPRRQATHRTNHSLDPLVLAIEHGDLLGEANAANMRKGAPCPTFAPLGKAKANQSKANPRALRRRGGAP